MSEVLKGNLNNSLPLAIVIAGPTASGKTALAAELSREINGEVVSADSMQIYKNMDIGTAKPSEIEKMGIAHHMLDIVMPDANFSVAQYKEAAEKIMKEIVQRGNIPVIAGGTGQYINALVDNIDFSGPGISGDIRYELYELHQRHGNPYMHKYLQEIDPDAASKIHENDTKRIIRAIEVYRQTGKTITWYALESRNKPASFRYLVFGLKLDRAYLYQRINERVDQMFEKGLLYEVTKLKKLGYSVYAAMKQALGYKEVLWYLDGLLSQTEMHELLKRNTRRYAKRQYTWFNRTSSIQWLEKSEITENKELIAIIKKYIDK